MGDWSRASSRNSRNNRARKCFEMDEGPVYERVGRPPIVTQKFFYKDYVAVGFVSSWKMSGNLYIRRHILHVDLGSKISRMKLGSELTGFRIRRVESIEHQAGDTKTKRSYLNCPVYYRYEISKLEDFILTLSTWTRKGHENPITPCSMTSISDLKQLMSIKR